MKLIKKIGVIFEEFTQQSMVEKTIRIVVGGHTDKETGSKEHNLNLSDERAQNVANVLMRILHKKNITIEAIGYGYKYPKANAFTLAEHRRITITIQPIAVEYLK